MPVLVLALLALQEATLDQVLDRMDRAAAASRGVSFAVGDGALCSVDSDGAVRLLRYDTEWRLDAQGLQRSERHASWGLGNLSTRYLRRLHERLTPSTCGPENPIEYDLEGHLLRALSPRRALAFEPGLRLVGRRTCTGKEHVLLQSRPRLQNRLSVVNCQTPPTLGGATALFWVSAADYRLSRIVVREFFSDPSFDFESETVFEEWRDGRPTTARERSWRVSSPPPAFRDHPVKPAPVPPALPTGLVSANARDPRLDQLVERSPDDPSLLLSRAIALDRRGSPVAWVISAPSDALVSTLSKVVSSTQDADSIRNLMAVLASSDRRADLAALATRAATRPELAPDAAEAFLFLDLPDRALALLPPAGPAGGLRTQALIARGETVRALSEIAAEPPGSLRHWPRDRDAFLKSVVEALSRQPDSALLQELRVTHAATFADFCRAAAEAAPHADVRPAIAAGFLQRLSTAPTADLTLALKGLAGDGAETALLRGLVHARLDQREDAIRELSSATDGLPSCPDYFSFMAVASQLLQPLSELGDAALFERAAQTVIAEIRRRGLSATLALHGLETWVLYCMKPGRQLRMARDFKGIPGLEGLLTSDYTNLKLSRDLRQQAVAILEDGVAATPEDPDLACWYEAMVDRDEGGRDFWRADRVEILERAREKSPRNAGVLLELARHYRQRGDARAARKALEDLGDRGVVLAEQQRRDGDPDAALATLRAIDFEDGARRPWEHWIAADTWERLGDPKQALACLERLRDAGYRPHLRMRRFGDDVEALRCLNRAIAEGYDLDVWDPYRRRGWVRPAAGPSDAELKLRRDELRRKIGLETLIDRLAAPALAADALRRARAALERLSSGSPAEREEAGAALRKIGPCAAPLLKPALRSDDADLRTRAVELALEWADPR